MLARRVAKFALGRDALVRPDLRVPYNILGSSYGGWPLVDGLLGPHSVVYSFGIGTDLSFDLALMERSGCIVHAFDPTPRSLEWLARQELPSLLSVIPLGLSAHDGMIRLKRPASSDYVSFGVTRLASSEETVEVPVRRLSTLMKQLRHGTIDLLKMDIEGAEYAVIDDMLASGIHPVQLDVEFHHAMHGWRIADTRRAVARLRGAGYRCYYVAPTGREMGFVKQ